MSSSFLVTIAGVTAAAPADGFIDNSSIEVLMAAPGATLPTTFAQSQAKERGNVRFGFLQQQLQFEGNIYISDIVAAGSDPVTQPTSFVFHATMEREEANYQVHDENNPGQFLTGPAAVKRLVARALIEGRDVVRAMYDPTQTVPVSGFAGAYSRQVARTETLTVAKLAANLTAAEALVTVTRL